jgi:hypothetical protein
MKIGKILHTFVQVEVSGVHKFILRVGVEESIVNAPRITEQLFQANLTFCVVCFY